MQSERKILADINQARDGWIQVTLSGDGAADLTEAKIEAALSAAEPKPMPSVAVENLITQVHDAIDEYREGMKGDKFGPHEWPTVDGIKTTVAQSLRRSALSAQVQDVAIPEGWQLVPVEPTAGMIEAAKSTTSAALTRSHANEIYRAMLAAAPEKQEGKP